MAFKKKITPSKNELKNFKTICTKYKQNCPTEIYSGLVYVFHKGTIQSTPE
jgi:hypothetical protein